MIQSLNSADSRVIPLTESHNVASEVCPGRELNLLCQTNSSYLNWHLAVPYMFNTPYMRFLSSTLSLNSLRPINVSGHIFNITRTSIEGSLPLESTLSVANVTTDIEGTRIDCLNNGSNLSTIIHVIRVGEEGIAMHIIIITIINSINYCSYSPSLFP